MTLEDILTLSRAGYTAQQITALNQQSFQRPQQMVQPQPQQMVQPQFGSNGQYTPVLPQNTTAPVQVDPMKDVMLEQYMNVPNMNMYDVKGVVADMIGANPPAAPANNNIGGVK